MKIFIICGRARHGKDTAASFIKDYYINRNKNVINLQYSSYIKEYAKRIIENNVIDSFDTRDLLQYLGTDYIKKEIDNLFFVKRIIDDIRVYSKYFDIVTISDARYIEEIEKIKEKFDDVYSIKVVRPNFDNRLTEKQQKHATEIALDNYDKIDQVVLNDGTLDDLNKKIIDLMEVINK